MRGESEPNVSDLRAICRVSGASAQWLVNGVGESGLIAPGVREMAPSYGSAAVMNGDLLVEIITAVEEAAAVDGAKIAINSKSAIISALYGLCRSGGIVDRDCVFRFSEAHRLIREFVTLRRL